MSNAQAPRPGAARPAPRFGDCDWNGLISAARAEQLIGSLAFRMEGRPVPARVAAIFEAARRDAAPGAHPGALGGGDGAPRAGAARRAGDPDEGHRLPRRRPRRQHRPERRRSRHHGAARAASTAVEAALLDAGWERVKAADGYDDVYYRRWMHELPPLIHRTRDRMIDVHHTILPLTARPRPDAAALIADSVALDNGLRILSPADIIVHAAAHLFADGDLAGGLGTSGTSTGCCASSTPTGFLARRWPSAPGCTSFGRPVARALRLSQPPLRHAGRPAAGRLLQPRRPAVRGAAARPQRLGAGAPQAASLRLLPARATGCACRR